MPQTPMRRSRRISRKTRTTSDLRRFEAPSAKSSHGRADMTSRIALERNTLRKRVEDLEGVIEKMVADIEHLKRQGEDAIWRPVTIACERAELVLKERTT